MSKDLLYSARKVAAQKWDVSPDVHPDDFLFTFLIENPSFRSKEDAVQYYFNDGANSAQKLGKLMKEVCGYANQPIELLEFASGYGCVTRHINKALPQVRVTACDIHPQAMKFLREATGVQTILSSARPADLVLNQTFDVVFALSFFSHMPKKSFAPWLSQLSLFVTPGGHLIFTTHGVLSQKFFQGSQLDESGFFFRPASEQGDLSTDEYGSAVTHPRFVSSQMLGVPGVALKFFQEGYWWEHQDVWVLRKLQRE